MRFQYKTILVASNAPALLLLLLLHYNIKSEKKAENIFVLLVFFFIVRVNYYRSENDTILPGIYDFQIHFVNTNLLLEKKRKIEQECK